MEKLGIKDKCQADFLKFTVTIDNSKKPALRHFTQKRILLSFENLYLISCSRFSEETHF